MMGNPLAKKSMIVAKISGFRSFHSTSSSTCHKNNTCSVIRSPSVCLIDVKTKPLQCNFHISNDTHRGLFKSEECEYMLTHNKDCTIMSHGATFIVFSHIFTLYINKGLCECQNVFIKFSCVLLLVSFIADLFIFSVKVSPFIPIFVLSILN
jgi:hypothetical protein